jgi:hypothetical protein
MIRLLKIAGQFLVIVALFAGVAALSNRPVYRQTPEGTGIIMLSFVHGANLSVVRDFETGGGLI